MILHLRIPAVLACSLTLGVVSSSNAEETAPETSAARFADSITAGAHRIAHGIQCA